MTDLKVAWHAEAFTAIIAFVPLAQVFVVLSGGRSSLAKDALRLIRRRDCVNKFSRSSRGSENAI
jgi:hypothetical protein